MTKVFNHILRMFRYLLQPTIKILVLPFILLVGITHFVNAQEQQEAPASPQIRVLPPAYNTQMMRLSEILGSLHYLRELCGAEEGQQWREQMETMIAQEEPIPERQAQMIASFNRGFRGFQETYRECTDAAIEANNRYLFEGAKLAGEIPTRYGR